MKHPVFFSLLALLLLLVASRARAQEEYKDAADEAEVQFVLGNDAYVGRDFKQALAHYFASNRLAPNRNVVFNIARAYEQLGQFAESFRYYQTFRDVAKTDDEKRAVAAALSRVTSSVALLDISTTPPGATLYIDRKELGGYGTTPRLLAVAPGKHTFILELAGHEPYRAEGVEMKVGQTSTVSAPLTRILGRLQVRGLPVGAEVRLDGPEPATATLPADVQVTPGRYRVTVTHPGHLVRELSVEVKAQATTEADVRLVRQTGVLVVQADERDALILVDGKAAGFTPAVLDGIPAGSHEVTVALDGFKPWTTSVQVAADERTLIDASLDASDEVAAASRTVQSAQDAPASVSLIPDREIKAFGARTVIEALQGERGVYPTDDGSYRSIGVRGVAPYGQYGNRLLIQIDGHTVNDDWIGSSFLAQDLMSDLDPVERLEFVRGPGSVLYGTGAFFGVINLVTHDQVPRHPVTAGITASSEGMTRGRVSTGVAFGDNAGMVISGGATYLQPTTFESPTLGQAQDINDLVSGSTLGRLWWEDLTLAWFFNRRDKSVATAAYETQFGDNRYRLLDNRAFVEARYEPQLTENVQLLARVYYDHADYEGLLPSADPTVGLLSERYEGNWIGVETRTLIRPTSGLSLSAGADYQYHLDNISTGKSNLGDTYLDEKHPFHALSAYVLGDYVPSDWFGLNAGVRFDGWWISDLKRTGGAAEERFLYSVNPRLALLFHPMEGGTIKLMGGSAFRAPSIYELTYSDGGATQVPSPDLQPEVIWTGELELSYRLPLELVATASVFVNQIQDRIEQVGNGDPGDLLHYENKGSDTWTLGTEFELARELARGWMVTAQYSYQRTRIGDLSGEQLQNAPEHLFGLKVVAPIARPSLLLGTRLVMESSRLDRVGEKTDGVVTWDITLSGTVAAAHLEYTLGVRNLTGWDTVYPVGEDLPDVRLAQTGRTFFADLTFFW